MNESVTRFQNYIAGEWVDAQSGEFRPNHNPADANEILGEFPRATQDDTRRAIDAAAAALPEWRRVSGPARSAILNKAANLMEERAQEIGRALTEEEGKTIGEGVGEAMRGAAILGYYAGEPLRPFGEHFQATNPDTFLIYRTNSPWGGGDHYTVELPSGYSRLETGSVFRIWKYGGV